MKYHSSHHQKLIKSLDKFVQQMQLRDKADNPQLVSKFVMRWTRAQPLLTTKLLEFILQSKSKIHAGEEAISVEKVVRNRLIKEFKQDKLTLNIRKRFYQQDLKAILRKGNGEITDSQKQYLLNLQYELGLSSQECQNIGEQCLVSFQSNRARILQHSIVFLANKQAKTKFVKSNYASNQNSNHNFILPLSKLPPDSSASEKTFSRQQLLNKQSVVANYLRDKWFWILLATPLLLILVKTWIGQQETVLTTNNINQKKDVCVDSASRQSPRMSLGEKLLTPEYNHLQSPGMIALYEGTAAFARCEFSTAQAKFQTSLNIGKNNPEALIYLNNAVAITQDHLKIAVSVPLGTKPQIAREILRGVAQVQSEVNLQGGIREKLLLVQLANDDNESQVARQVATKLTADQSVLAVIGHNTSDSSLAASKIYQKRGLTMISPTSTSTKLSGIGSHILRTTPSVAFMANTLADYASVNNYSKITVCVDSSSSASSSFVEEFLTEITKDGAKMLKIPCDFAQDNLEPQMVVDRAIANDADAILLAPSLKKIDQAIAIAQQNQQQLPLLGSHSLYTFETIKYGQEAVKGMVLSVPWLPDSRSKSSFSQATSKYWGSKVNWRTAMAHDATVAIVQGLKHSDTRSKLHSVVTHDNFSVQGVTGVFHFEKGDRTGRAQLAHIIQPSSTKPHYQFSRLNLSNRINEP